jgi:hypothetical protein
MSARWLLLVAVAWCGSAVAAEMVSVTMPFVSVLSARRRPPPPEVAMRAPTEM